MRDGGFRVQFDGTNHMQHFNWWDIVRNPYSLMFFGTPLTQSRAFDSIFHSINSYKASAAPSMAPQKKLIYSVFGLLNTHIELLTQVSFQRNYVTSIKEYITIDLH